MDDRFFDWGYAWEILPRLGEAFLITVEATLLGTVIALTLGLAWAIARRSRQRPLALAATWVVEFVRSTPLLVQLYFLFYVLPSAGLTLSPLTTGAIGLGLHYSAYMAEVYRAGIDGVPRQQWEAALALGFGRWHTWRAIILPQAIPPVVPALGNYIIGMFKDTPLLSAITVLEVLQVAKILGSQSFRYLEPLTLVGALLLAVSLLASQLVQKLEKTLAIRSR
ncbi:ectoine/hydroxyectoine ABC transporter permease subunit EhuD [Haliangium sp.]|uniref:ectoine/hydroxyectoine ABC transporter permease subunit EhuD n=1 Tax=Haliangium sp. TaxID=2663208 RepID=UPI003D10E59A